MMPAAVQYQRAYGGRIMGLPVTSIKNNFGNKA